MSPLASRLLEGGSWSSSPSPVATAGHKDMGEPLQYRGKRICVNTLEGGGRGLTYDIDIGDGGKAIRNYTEHEAYNEFMGHIPDDWVRGLLEWFLALDNPADRVRDWIGGSNRWMLDHGKLVE